MSQKWTKVKDLKVGSQIAVHDNGNLSWDEIVSIKSVGREQVYDIEVENSHNFVGNGILAHNTYIFGNVGIGTSTPTHKLEVSGDIAAQAFINISTKEAKKDIEFLTNIDEDSILNKIASTTLATYIYTDDQTNEKHLGLIAEQSPLEILSADSRGVDLYKMATFAWAGIKSQQSQIDKMKSEIVDIKIRIEDLQNNAGSIPQTDSNSILSSIISLFRDTYSLVIENGLLKVTEIIADKITAKKVVAESFEIKDSATGEIWCVKISNGEWDKLKGTCEVSTTTPVSEIQQPVSESELPASDTAPPTLTLQGNNPAMLHIGDSYIDLGVIASDNVDENLGYEVWRDGELLGRNLTDVSVDTSQPGEHSIGYSATDNSGNTATTTRQVIVEGAEEIPPAEETATTTPSI